MFGLRIVKDKQFYKEVLVIMVPVVLQQAVNMGVNMMDTMMVGQLGEAQISASSLANSFYLLFNVFCMGLIGGCSVLAAQYWGKHDTAKAKETFTLAFYLSAAASLLFALATLLFPNQIMRIYTDEEDVIAYGVLYLNYTVWIYFFHGTSLVFSSLMRSVNKPKLGMWVSLASFFVNIGANWIFIFGNLGAPRMEIAGAALGTLIARIVEFLLTFGYIFICDKTLRLRLSDLLKPPTKELFYNYGRLGLAALISDCLLGLGTNMVNMVLGRMGAAVVAAAAICQVVERMFTVIVAGVANAASILTGQTVGKGKIESAKAQGETFYVLSIALGLLCSLLVLLFGRLTIAAYTLTAETIRITEEMMLAYTVIVFFYTIQTVMTKGVLRGGGDTRFLMIADILFLWVLSVPLGYYVGLVLHGSAWLTALCLKADWCVKSFWCLGRLKSGKWIRETKKLQ